MPDAGLQQYLQEALQTRKQSGLHRHHRVLESAPGVRLNYAGHSYLNFCSNDYLGLANHPQLVAAFKLGAERWGVGAGAAHLICGHHRSHERLQEALAEFTSRPAALLFSTGYMANLGTVAALLSRGELLFEDRLNHASLIDAALLCGARLLRYRHGAMDHLHTLLDRQTRGLRGLVATDGVFSMDGDLAPLADLVKLCNTDKKWLLVDDAHGLGVLGATGAGTVQHFDLDYHQVPILIGTFGKAMGCFGAFVAGSQDLIDYLVQFSRTYIYTTAPPPALADTVLAALQLIQTEPWRRQHLQALITRFQCGAKQLALPLMPSRTPIQPIIIGNTELTRKWSQALWNNGIYVSAIREPSVPKGKSRLRITLTAAHSTADVDRLLANLADTQKTLGTTPI